MGQGIDAEYIYPPNYAEIKEYVLQQNRVSHSTLSTKFNLRYHQSVKVIRALQYDGLVSKIWMPGLNGYAVYH